MKPRYNPTQPQQQRQHSRTQPLKPRQRRDSSHGSKPTAQSDSFSDFVAQPGTPPEPELVLEHEVSTDELNRFVLRCIELLAVTKQNQSPAQLVESAIAERLPTVTALKADLTETRHAQRGHHVWTKQLVDAVEPLLKSEAAPQQEQQKLSNLALQCVEENLQMHNRMEQLSKRIDFLGGAIAKHLIQIGQEIGLPLPVLEKLAKFTEKILKQI
ncbi:MAG: hypothetical protein ACPG32_08505 [Akkermansiaceae bacterium]